jgi:hypothetical protein
MGNDAFANHYFANGNRCKFDSVVPPPLVSRRCPKYNLMLAELNAEFTTKELLVSITKCN